MGLIIGENCYFDVPEADEIVRSILPSFDEGRKFWDGLDENDKVCIVLDAMSKIDTDSMLYRGKRVNTESKLQFPREYHGVIIECPLDIKKAIVEQAIRDFKDYGNELEQMRNNGVHSFSDGGGASVTFESNKKFKSKEGVFSDIYYRYISKHTMVI